MAHLENILALNLGIFFKNMTRKKHSNGNYIKFGNEEIDTNRTHLNYNLQRTKKMDFLIMIL